MDKATPEARLKAKAKYFDDCKEAYRSIKYDGVAQVKDTRRIPEGLEEEDDVVMQDAQPGEDVVMQDVQQGEMQVEKIDLPKLHQGSYVMGSTVLDCLIYKVHSIDPQVFPMFRLLESVRHPAIVRHHTFYEEAREPRIALSWVDCRVWDLLTTDKACTRFFKSTKSGTSLGTMFKTMIIDMCSGLEHLFKLDLYPPKIDLDDLYACKDGPNNYRVQVLILKVDKLTSKSNKRTRTTALWTQVKEIVEDFRTGGRRDKLSEVDNRFINYIGRDVTMLAQYPLSWSYDQKGRYLISIISADMSIICEKLQRSGLKWPKEGSTLDLPKILQVLIDHDYTRDHPYKYSTAKPYDYVMLCRTVYKHFPALSKQLPSLKDMFRTRQDFLERMEKWEPLIWCILYDAIGLIASLPSSTSGKSNGSW